MKFGYKILLSAVSLSIITFGVFGTMNRVGTLVALAKTKIARTSEQVTDSTSVNKYDFGINVATWDYQMLDPTTVSTINSLGTGVQQFPNSGDLWNWETDTSRDASTNYTTWDPYKEPLSLDGWGKILKATNNQGLYIVDYGTNGSFTGGATPQDAKKITEYIVQHNLPITAMVIGSEAYGDWRVNLNSSHTPQTYAETAKQMAIAIHSVDPSMKVGVDLTYPVLGAANTADLYWNQVVLQTDAPYIQFVSAHSYVATQTLSDSGLLNYLDVIPSTMALLKQQIAENAGTNAANIQVWITELNPYQMGTPTQSIQPIYGAALIKSVLLYRANGASQIDWWSLHGGAHPVAADGTLSDATDSTANTLYGTNGLFADGISPEPSINQAYPSAVAYSQLMKAIGSGGQVRVHSGRTWFVAAVTNANQTTWFVINNSTNPASLQIGGSTVAVAPAAMQVFTSNQNNWPFQDASAVGASAARVAGPVNVPVNISSVSSNAMWAGQEVSVNGSGFGTLQGNGYVQLKDATTSWGAPGNAAEFQVLSWSDNKITFLAPSTQGSWSLIPGTLATIQLVTNDLKVSNLESVSVVSAPSPTVQAVSPSSISPGTVVTITGQGFGDAQSSGYLHLSDSGINWGMVGNQAVLQILSWSDTKITFIAPGPSGPAGTYYLTTGTMAQVVIVNSADIAANPISLKVV